MKRKILYALLSAVIAIGLWVYVVTVVSPESTETYRNISVVIDGESLLRDRGLMIVTEKIPSITLKLSGNRSDLRKLNSSNITITVDVSRISAVGTKELQYAISYPGDVPSGSIQVMSQSPEKISITVVEAARITVPIDILSPNRVNEPYWVDSSKISASQEKVTVEGPAEVIARIKSAAVTVDVSNKTETIKEDFPVVLYDAEGNMVENRWLTLSAPQINVTVPIYLKKDVAIDFQNVVHNGGTNATNTKLEVTPGTVTVYGSTQVISKLDKIMLTDKIDLGNFTNGDTITIDITNEDLGLGVYLFDGENTTVTVTVKMENLDTRIIQVPTNTTNVKIISPEGFTAKLTENYIKVSLRGPANKLSSIKPEHIYITVDASNLNSGTDIAPYTVTMAEGYTEFGAIGYCKVAVKLQ